VRSRDKPGHLSSPGLVSQQLNPQEDPSQHENGFSNTPLAPGVQGSCYLPYPAAAHTHSGQGCAMLIIEVYRPKRPKPAGPSGIAIAVVRMILMVNAQDVRASRPGLRL